MENESQCQGEKSESGFLSCTKYLPWPLIDSSEKPQRKKISDLTWILPDLKKLARTYAGLEVVENIFYSRKNFLRPDLQPESCAFENEVALLDAMFPGDGAAYCMGR